MSSLMHCLIGFDWEICRLTGVLVILVEEKQTAELQTCTVCTCTLYLGITCHYWQMYCIVLYCTVLHYSRCIVYSRFVLSGLCSLISWHHYHLPVLERVQLASREGHQGNFQIGQIIHIKTTCSNLFLKYFKHWNDSDLARYWFFLEI